MTPFFIFCPEYFILIRSWDIEPAHPWTSHVVCQTDLRKKDYYTPPPSIYEQGQLSTFWPAHQNHQTTGIGPCKPKSESWIPPIWHLNPESNTHVQYSLPILFVPQIDVSQPQIEGSTLFVNLRQHSHSYASRFGWVCMLAGACSSINGCIMYSTGYRHMHTDNKYYDQTCVVGFCKHAGCLL